MMDRNVDCLCQHLHCGPFLLSRLDRFAAVRMECLAIRELFVPDTIHRARRIPRSKSKQRPGAFRCRAFYFTATLFARHAQWPLRVPRVTIAVAKA